MKKWILITAAVMFAAGLALGGAYIALAQGGNPPTVFGPGWMHSGTYTGTVPFGTGPRGGMMGGWGNGQAYTGTVPFGRGPMMGSGAQSGPLFDLMDGTHVEVWTAVAQELDMTYDQLQEALKTETLAQLAQEKNVTLEKLQEVCQAAHKTALDKLVTEGKLTQAQADWMIQRMEQMGGPILNGYGRGAGPCWDNDDQPGAPQSSSPRGRGGMMGFFGGRQG
jgi:uncharacterized protein YidB (DUF937 family)